jgi:hypothetical protein
MPVHLPRGRDQAGGMRAGHPDSDAQRGVAVRPSPTEDCEHVLYRPLAVGAGALTGVVVDDPEVAQHATLECCLDDRLERQAISECLEPLLVVDCHAQDLPRLGELGLEVAGVAEPEGSLRARAVFGLAQGRAERSPVRA